MAQYLPLPDGSSVTIREGETPQQAWERAQEMYPEAFGIRQKQEAAPEGGFLAASKAGLAGLKGDIAALAGRTGAVDEAAAEKYIAEQEAYKKKTFKPTEKGWTEAPGTKIAELLGSSLPYMAAPIVAGAVAPEGLAALGAAGLASATQFAGSNLSRQMDEGKKLGETNLAAAAAAAVPQAALDALSLKMLPGIRSIFAAAGKEVPERVAAEIAKQGTMNVAKDYALATGKAMGTEGLTEAGQQFFERLQAGLNISDEKARDEYWDSLVGGAVLGGVLAPAGRYVERRGEAAKQQIPQQDELAKLRAEEEQRLEADRQRKATPEYAQEVVQKYDALAQQKQALVGQIKKIVQDSPTADADRAFNRDINAQLKELDKQIKPLAEEYYPAKKQVDAIAKQAELAKMPVEDYMLQQMGMQVKPVEAPKAAEPVVRRGKGQLFGVEETPAPAPDTSLQDYAKGQYEAARNVGVFDMGDTADYMMQDPAKAAEMVKTRTKLPDLTASENSLLLSGIKMRLDAKEKQARAASKQELAQRQETLKAQTLTQPEDQMALFKESEAQVEEQKKNAEPNFDYLDPMFEKALEGKTVIAVDPSVKPIARGPQVRERIDALIAEADKADQAYRTARYAMPAQGKRGAPERAAAMEALTKGKTALEKIEQISKEGGAYAREVIAARRAQQEAMAKLSDITEQLRTEQTLGKETERVRNPDTGEMETRLVGFGKGVSASTEQSLINQAEKLRGQLISSALQEAALHRRAAGNPAITQDEAIKAASSMFDSVNEWLDRAKQKPVQPEYEEVITEPAQMRANKIVRPAKTERRVVKEGVPSMQPQEVAQFQERIKSAMRDLYEKPEVKVQRVEAGPLKRQFAAEESKKTAEARGETAKTLGGELRRRTEFVRNKMSKMGAMRPGARDALNAAADLMDKNQATRDILDKVEPVVDAIVAGRDVKQVDIQAIKDAIRATEEVPQGQKALFPEAQEDLGYIRATPANFAKSPRIKPVWAAIDHARELFKKTEPVRLAKEATRKNRLKLLNQLEERMDSIRKDTQFFWKDTSRWSDAEMAKVFAGMPEAGTTQAEKDILYKYAKAQKLTPQEQATAEKLLRDFRSVELPKYQARVGEAMQLLAQGRRLADADNQLLAFMQDTNANVRAAAKALNERMAGMRDTVKYLKDVMRGSAILTPEQKALLESEKAVEQQRGAYQQAVEKAITKATADMEAARAALLDPQIGQISKELETAKKTLDKEQAELDKIKKRFDSVLAQKEGANRTELATYELFRYEEKKGVIDDLKEKVKTQEDALDKLVTERHEEFDGATVVIQAMLDNNVKFERQYLEMQESALAAMRGEAVLDNPNAYPFAYRQAKKNLEAQEQTVKAAEKRATAFKEVVKSDQQQMEDFWKDKLGGEGVKREDGKVERLQSTADKEAARLREEAIAALDKEERAAEQAALKAAQVESIDTEVAGLITELGAYEDFPNELSALKKMADDESLSQVERDAALAKAGVIQNITSLEAQREVLLEGKPRKKQKAATAPSTSAMAAQKPMRTGYRKALEAASEGMKAERESGIYGEFSNDPFMANDYDSVTASLTATLRDDFDNLFMESTKAPVFYKNQRTFNVEGPEGRVAFRVELFAEKSRASTFEKRIEMALKRVELNAKAEVEIFEGDPEYREMYKEAKENLEAVRKMSASDFTDTRRLPAVKKVVAVKTPAVFIPPKPPVAKPKNLYTEADYTSDAVAKELGTEFVTDAPFHGMTFADAAKYGAKRTSSPQVSELFMRLADVFESSPAEGGEGRVYAVEGLMRDRAAGLYNTRLNVVYTRAPSRASSNANKILLHELTHAATSRALNESPVLRKRVEELRQKTVDWLETKEGKAYFRQHGFGLAKTRQSIYALKNEHEFIAELFANRDFQKLLTEIPSDKPRKSIFTRFVEIMSKYFDMPAKAAQSLFAESVALTEEILAYTKAELYENNKPIQDLKSESLAYQEPVYSEDFSKVGNIVNKTVAQNRSWWDKVKANTTGLAFETQLVDRFAGFERLAKYMEPLKGTQMLYYLRTYDQRMNMVSQSVANGAPEILEKKRADGQTERIVESTNGASLRGIVNTLKDAKQYIGNGEAVNQVFTTYMAAIRAANKGIETLNFGTDKDGKPVLTQAMLDEVTNLVNANPALKKTFEDARKEYNQYNRDMLDFVASTGALSKELVKKLVAEDDYIPFYRERKGVVELVIGNEPPIRIGSIAEQPYLDKLVGGDTAILDFMTSSVQNTNMLMDMGLRNLATKNAVMELVDLKAATLVKKAEGPDVVKFKVDGDDRYAIIATEKVKIGNKEFETGVPADILVKGMEGIPTQMPFLFKVMSIPAQGLRKAVTLSPLYMAKQLFRDSLAAPILSGADFAPVMGALKQIGAPSKEILERRGITGGQQFKGTSEDLSKILRDITEGQPGWMQALGKFEALGMEADALTRRAQYNSYIEQGLSEMEATLMALESMNFNKRGASPSVHVANALIPFFNAQIQGLNVLYKAMFGKMPFNDQLRIREKMLMRGGLMAGATLLYAAMMEDDDAYKNATPDQKYGSWFVRLPGVDEPVRIPVPFEIGYIFKALPEALYNSMTTEHGGEEAVKAFKQILLQTVPGGSSYGIPQAIKPAIEVGLGKSFYTGRDILSEREKKLLPEEQYRANTTDAAKALGSGLGISPIKIEALVNGYTGTMGLAFLQALSFGVPAKETPEQAVKRLSEYPVVGGVFQPNDAGGIINSVYERMNENERVRSTVRTLVNEGKTQEAMALLTKRGNEYMESELGDKFKANMNKLTQAERAIAASNISAEAKRKQLDDIRKMKIALANMTRDISDKTIHLTGFS